jgi:hypothetical protein
MAIVVLMCFPGLCAETGDGRLPDEAVLTIDMKGAEDCPPGLIDEMQAEAEEVFRPAGVKLEWRYLDLSRIRQAVASLVVVTFTGTCKSDGFGQPTIGEGPLGWTSVTDGAILPFCGVHYDRVREVMLRTIRHLPKGEQERLFGQALGRVLAHELYHILANTRSHARSGLAKPLLSDADLAREELYFNARELELIHDALYRPARPASRTSRGDVLREGTAGQDSKGAGSKPVDTRFERSVVPSKPMGH